MLETDELVSAKTPMCELNQMSTSSSSGSIALSFASSSFVAMAAENFTNIPRVDANVLRLVNAKSFKPVGW